MRKLLVAILGISVVAAFACGSAAKSAVPTVAPTSTPVSDEAFKAAAAKAASGIELMVTDLPGGWTGKIHHKSDTKFDLSPECSSFNDAGVPNAVIDQDSDDFTDAAKRGVSSGASVYRTHELALKDTADVMSLLTTCRQEIARAMQAYIVKDAPGVTAAVTFDLVAPNELGGWNGGYKLSISANSATGANVYQTDVTAIWKLEDRVVTTFEYDGSTPVEPAMRDALKALLTKRTVDANAALPN